MTRVIPITVANSIDSGSASLAWGITIVRADGMRYAFVSGDRSKTIDSDVAIPGFDLRSLSRSAGLAVDNTEITIVDPDDMVTRDDVAAGRWDGATFEIFQFNWKDPTGGALVQMVGNLGNLQPKGPAYIAELRDLRQPLQQDNTAVLQPTCRYRFCDERCTLDEADFSHAVTVTSVTNNLRFNVAPVGSPAEGGFTEGEVRWLTGQNSDIRAKVRAYDEGTGEFTLAAPMVFDIEVGDTAIAIEGCLKTREACKGYQNILNFGGEPDKPTIDKITGPAEYGS